MYLADPAELTNEEHHKQLIHKQLIKIVRANNICSNKRPRKI